MRKNWRVRPGFTPKVEWCKVKGNERKFDQVGEYTLIAGANGLEAAPALKTEEIEIFEYKTHE